MEYEQQLQVYYSEPVQSLPNIVINNEAHETVGGLPTVAGSADMVAVAKACGYQYAASVAEFAVLDAELAKVKEAKQLSFLEVKCAIGAREDLGRPTTTAMDNKRNFMKFLQER